MRKAISILILIFLLFIGFEFFAVYLKEAHEVKFNVYYEDKIFEIEEKYSKEYGDTYNIKIKNNDKEFYYVIKNDFNKQKEIIEKIEYFEKDNYVCIYPILENGQGTYLECNKNNTIYAKSYFSNNQFIKEIDKYLLDKGYDINKDIDTTNTTVLNKSTVYMNNLLENDYITLWSYKGIDIISKKRNDYTPMLDFDKYENKHGYLVGKYYIVPTYLSSRIQEFNSVNILNIETRKIEKVELGVTLSSNTYINGVVDNKLYYTDSSNLIQVEINPSKNNSRVIGNKEIGGQKYNGSWENCNIYEVAKNKVIFRKENNDLSKYSYTELKETDSSYYLYTKEGNLYQVPKNDIGVRILLFSKKNISNINVIEDIIYFVENDTLYYYSNIDGIVPILKNNELRYNTNNRVGIYRK